jgi:AcrR family transcriptional regulator
MGIAERKQREKEYRLNEIKKNAKRLFAKKGFASTSMAEIATATEIAKGSLYLFFKSKAELLYSLLEPMLEDHYRLIARITDNEEEKADDTLLNLIDFFYRSYKQDPEPYQVFMYFKADEFSELLAADRFNHLKRLMARNLQEVESVIDRGNRQGIFKPFDPKVISIIIWNTVLSILQFEQNRQYKGGKDHLKSTLDAAINLLLVGLKK